VKSKLHIMYPVPRGLGRRAPVAVRRTDARVYHHASAFGGSRLGGTTEGGIRNSAYSFPSLKNAKIALASIRKIKIPKAKYRISQRGPR